MSENIIDIYSKMWNLWDFYTKQISQEPLEYGRTRLCRMSLVNMQRNHIGAAKESKKQGTSSLFQPIKLFYVLFCHVFTVQKD